MKRAKNTVDKIVESVLIFLMSVMVLNVLWQVFTRFILRDPSVFTDELARYLLIWLGLLGAAYVVGQKQHLAIDYLLNKFNPSSKRKLQIFIQALVFLFALFAMVIGGANLVSLTLYLKQTSAALQIELGYVYLVLPISGLLILFYAVENMISLFQESRMQIE